jgi:hypothetical protein
MGDATDILNRLRRKASKRCSRGDKPAKSPLSTPESGKRAPILLVDGGRGPFKQDLTPCPFQTGVVDQKARRVARMRKRRRSLIEEPTGCAGGEPPCYQHLFEGL